MDHQKRRRSIVGEISEYLVRKAQRKAKKLKLSSSSPSGDEKFVWRKKIEDDVMSGRLSLEDAFSVKSEKKKHMERMAEIQRLKKRRKERDLQKARREQQIYTLARDRARADYQDWEKREAEFDFDQSKLRSEIQGRPNPIDLELKSSMEDGGDAIPEVDLDLQVYSRKPKYLNRVHCGYEWNRYNQTHYDHDNPPPKIVHGYKFNVLYPDLVDKSKAPAFTIDRDWNSEETCIIRFHAGPPYQDIAFRIVNREWDKSAKKGYKCTFEGGVLRLYFGFERCRYRR